MFPTVDFDDCASRTTPNRTLRKCFVGQVEVNLSRWQSTERALVWSAPTVHLGVVKQKAAAAYAEHPWSLTTYAETEAEALRVRGRLWMRPAGELRSAG